MIGVFDSGVGGLTVLRGFLKKAPYYDYVYLGDNANVPYGNKSPEIIYDNTKKAVDFLAQTGCKLIIIACNSVSAQALRRIQQEYLPEKHPSLKVLGVIRPIVEEVHRNKEKIKRIGIIGTRATINSEAYIKEMQAKELDFKFFQKATPLLVPLVEEGWSLKPETRMILKKYLRSLKVDKVDSLLLACTHYPFLFKDIKRIMGKNCIVFDVEEIIAKSLVDYLSRHGELGIVKKDDPKLDFYATDNVERFKELGRLFLGRKILKVNKTSI